MPFQLSTVSFFKPSYHIKYITGWDTLFKPEKYSGPLKFYNSNPALLIDVCINADRNKLDEEDIEILIGDYHSLININEVIEKNKTLIYEICKQSISSEFVFDLGKLKVIEPDDFTDSIPKFGLGTFFMFSNITSPIPFYCVVNPSRHVGNHEFYAWFMSYVYSNLVCLAPREKISDYAKLFLQAASLLCSSNGSKNTVNITNSTTILECGLGNNGEMLLPIPGVGTKRYEQLIEKSLEQMSKHGKKKGNRK